MLDAMDFMLYAMAVGRLKTYFGFGDATAGEHPWQGNRCMARLFITGLAGLLTAYVAQNLHFNPRWYGDTGPGVGKLPREIVAGYMETAYGKGQVAEAAKLYYTRKTIDVTPDAPYRSDSRRSPRTPRTSWRARHWPTSPSTAGRRPAGSKSSARATACE